MVYYGKALKAKEETEIQEYYEKIEMIRTELRLNNPNYEPPTLEQMQGEFNNNQKDWVEDINRKMINNVDTLILITKEGYTFHITENETKYMAKGEITEAANPKVTAKSLDMSNCVRKTKKYFADLFEIEWASDGVGTIEYTITRKSKFQEQRSSRHTKK